MSEALAIVPTPESPPPLPAIPFRIKRAGCYPMADVTYHNDPCPTPSLSAGMINDILIAPALCRENSKRLNPEREDEDSDEKFTIGIVSHVIYLEQKLFDKKVVEVNFPDWRSKEAKAARANARAEGRTPILAKHMARVMKARASFLKDGFVKKAFAKGRTEHALFWRHPIYKIWCRARPDFIATDRQHINDYKTTTNADPDKFGTHALNLGYYRRAAWYIQGAETVFRKKMQHYWFVNQETKPPYMTSVIELDFHALEQGKIENNEAARLFAHCLKTKDWFGYRHKDDQTKDRAFQVGLPSWYYQKFDEGRI